MLKIEKVVFKLFFILLLSVKLSNGDQCEYYPNYPIKNETKSVK
jgi:hypothetical protein